MMRLLLAATAAVSLLCAGASAQTSVRTEAIRPPPQAAGAKTAHPEIIADRGRLPPAVARTLQRILEAARSGELDRVVAAMKSGKTMPVFSLAGDADPAEFWRDNYPDSAGVEALAILVTILESPFVHADRGTAEEMYIWPYFARTPLAALTPAQNVELLRIVTGADYREMAERGAYTFYRLGIAPDGTWRFFVSGD